jgi:hypothetical protein
MPPETFTPVYEKRDAATSAIGYSIDAAASTSVEDRLTRDSVTHPAWAADELSKLRAEQARLQERRKRLLELQKIEDEEEQLQRRIEEAESKLQS